MTKNKKLFRLFLFALLGFLLSASGVGIDRINFYIIVMVIVMIDVSKGY